MNDSGVNQQTLPQEVPPLLNPSNPRPDEDLDNSMFTPKGYSSSGTERSQAEDVFPDLVQDSTATETIVEAVLMSTLVLLRQFAFGY